MTGIGHDVVARGICANPAMQPLGKAEHEHCTLQRPLDRCCVGL
eukprot:CAMPEP_0183352486 /NCGR_PEP_ID=MMETSP0164_2-20130417/29471_1 /TAXON_ID=221442 /ORGANISM="Coccolithus pelagicus ssp braarudi, Strain PLY182g" /LENGTH=43 /DNA_ID= /DNA_START= /DNA_END= /DNA_ORIENTATION=